MRDIDTGMSDAALDALDRWADGYVEEDYRTGEDEVVYADESEYIDDEC